MALLVLLGSGFFLASVAMLDQKILQLVFLLLFVLAGLLVRYKLFTAYLGFSFIYPLLPSQSQHLVTINILEFFFLSFAFWWAFQRIREGRWRLPVHSLNPLLSLLLLVTAISVLLALLRNHFVLSEVFFIKLKEHWNIFKANTYPDLGPLHSLIYLLEGILFFYITIDVLDTPEKVHRTARTILYSAVLVSVLGILQYAFRFHLLEYWVRENPEIVRINSTFSDPNSLGTYLVTIFCFATLAYLSFSKGSQLYLALLGIVFLALLFTASRAGLAAAFVVPLLLPTVVKWFGVDAARHLRGPTLWLVKRGVYVAVGAVTVLVIAALLINYQNPKPGSLFQIILYSFNPQLTFDQVLKGRVAFWKIAFDVFQDYPMFGSGPGTFLDVQRKAPYFLTQPENAHNYFLQILSETGILGLLSFCAILVQTLRLTMRKLRGSDAGDFSLSLGFLAGWIAFLVTCFTGHPLLLLKLQFVFWSFLGFLLIQTKSPQLELRSRLAGAVRPVIVFGILLIAALQIVSTLRSRAISVYEHGYHTLEKDEEGNFFRWTSRAAISNMEVRGKVLSFSLRQLNPEFVKKSGYVKLFLNDELLDVLHFTDINWREVTYYLPQLREGTRATLRIEPENWFIPFQSATDRRELGIAVRNFVWKCSLNHATGVHELEREGTESFYWTQGQASFPLYISGNTISFRLLPNSYAEKEPLEAVFYWDDLLIHRMKLNRVQWQNVFLNIPAGRREGILTMRVSRTINPKRTGKGTDLRDLGLRISWPFQSGGKPAHFKTTPESPGVAALYGISNNRNHPVRLLSYSFESADSQPEILRSGLRLPGEPRLLDSVSAGEKNWITIFSNAGPDGFLVLNNLKQDVPLSGGPVVVRMNARGNIVASEAPVASLLLNGREVARQPIFYEDWVDYYFPVLLAEGRNQLSVRFVNDYYSPVEGMDRNLFIREIAVIPAKLKPVELKAGWQALPDRILIAEPVDPSLPFSPQDYCYRISPDK